MAFVVITSLLEIIDHQLLQPHPYVKNILSIADDPKIRNTMIGESLSKIKESLSETAKSLSNKLRFLQTLLFQKKIINEAEIRGVIVKAEIEIESQLKPVYSAAFNHRGCHELHPIPTLLEGFIEACYGLQQTLQEVVKDIESLEAKIQNEKENSYENEMLGLVGYEDEFLHIKDMIESSDEELKVISVTGMGGIGKTTLAKKAFKDSDISIRFDVRAWVVVSQEYDVKEILIRLLHSIDPTRRYVELEKELRRALLGRRYFIVIDDIWNDKALWDRLRLCFPDNECGSRILLTTRDKEFANYACSSSREYIHPMRFLNIDESWDLFEREVFGGKHCIPKLHSIGRLIVKKCQGLPLAIVVMARLLASLKKSPEEWSNVFENMESLDPNNKLSRIFSLSYDYLPSHLKACLIYLGVFPKNNDIHVNKLINLWVAERFLYEDMGKNLEEVAESYLNKLINQNLVQVSKRSLDGKIKSCKLHDRLYEMCVKEARKEQLLDCRWISCISTRWPASDKFHSIKSVLYFGKEKKLPECRLVFLGLDMLRVLDLSLLKCFHELPSEIVDLVHLRYLALSPSSSITNLQIIKLQNLQTFVVYSTSREGACDLQLPGDILELPRLRHVRLDKRFSVYLPENPQENLQTLLWLRVVSGETDFTKVPNLKELWVYYIDKEPKDGVFDTLCHLELLQKLKFESVVHGFRLPSSLPKHLKKLTLCNTYLQWEEDMMKIIQMLPNLEVLKLKKYAFCGPNWDMEDGIFKRLKLFVIAYSDLKCWIADADHFPVLDRLVLKFCLGLEELPSDFARINTLKLIELESCCPSLVESAKEIQKEQQELSDKALDIRVLGPKVEFPNDYI